MKKHTNAIKSQRSLSVNKDKEERHIEGGQDKQLNSYILEFFVFPKAANKLVYEYQGSPHMNYIAHN